VLFLDLLVFLGGGLLLSVWFVCVPAGTARANSSRVNPTEARENIANRGGLFMIVSLRLSFARSPPARNCLPAAVPHGRVLPTRALEPSSATELK
jgi:hypothetical protein